MKNVQIVFRPVKLYMIIKNGASMSEPWERKDRHKLNVRDRIKEIMFGTFVAGMIYASLIVREIKVVKNKRENK